MKRTRKLLSGERFDRLTVIDLDHTIQYISPNGQTHNVEFYLCICNCGKTKVVRKSSLINKKCRSCGCLEYENQKSKLVKYKTHNKTGTRIYKCWSNMKSRCYRKKDIDYKHYNNLGITVCEEWKNNPSSFIAWAYKNGYDDNLTLDRIDTTKGYYPENCRWITTAEQNRNQTRTIKILYKNNIYCLSELSKLLNIPRTTLKRKINAGLINNAIILSRHQQ